MALKRSWPGIVSVAFAAVLWEVVGRLHLSDVVVPLSSILVGWVQMLHTGEITGSLGTSLFELAVGFGGALILGVITGILMGRYPAMQAMLGPYVNAFLVAPMSALVPLLALLFGLGPQPIIVSVFMFGFFTMVINFAAAIRNAPPLLQEMARSYGAGERQILRRIVIPHGLPFMLAGVRLGLSRSIKGMIIGEILIALVGIGGRLETYGEEFELVPLFALLLTVVALAILLTGVLRLIERRVAPWYYAAAERGGVAGLAAAAARCRRGAPAGRQALSPAATTQSCTVLA